MAPLAFLPAKEHPAHGRTTGSMHDVLQSLNYSPSPDLAPFIRNHFVFRAPMPVDVTLVDELLSETAMIRILMDGQWDASFVDGQWHREGPCILFGPNTRCFKVRVTGPFMVAGCAIRPSGWAALFPWKADGFTDRMLSLQDYWPDLCGPMEEACQRSGADDGAVVAALEAALRARLAQTGHAAPDPQMATFEEIANNDSTMRVTEAAEVLGLSLSALKRRCQAHFGLTPKAVLRRSRFLDMAAAIRGISNPGDEERAALRFSDQSHLNREFRHFINMTPGAFEKAQTPFLDAVLKLREDRDKRR
jgi:AraC-like DNA-binding protein